MNVKLTIGIFLIIASLAACKKGPPQTPQNVHTGPDVYLTGLGSGGSSGTVYWKNNTLISLPGGASTTGIAVSGSDVYIAGNINYAVSSGNTTEAVYWKNGVMTKLADGASYASAIAVSGTDVFISGLTVLNNIGVSVYWKNDTLVSLGSNSFADAIAASGNDVYVAGMSGNSNNAQLATYWKNGVKVFLEDSVLSEANAVAISGNDVYVAGLYSTSDAGSEYQAVYWKNGIRVILPVDSTILQSYATGIGISGTDVHVVGFVYNYSGLQGVYWKNGIMTYLNNMGGTGNIVQTTNAVVVSGTDVYLSLNATDYWKNGQKVPVPNDGIATSIAVQP